MQTTETSLRKGAAPARFDKSSQHRRSMIAKINIGRQQLNLVEDDYRQMLFDATGETSLRQCDEGQLNRMLQLLKSKGFRPMPKGRGGSPRPAQHPMARKARALWISLYQLGVVRNSSEVALEAFAKRQLGCEKLVWARQSDGNKLIEALKAMGEKKGWRMRDAKTGKPYGPEALKGSLCHAILKRLKALGVARMDWGLHDAAWKLCGSGTAKRAAGRQATMKTSPRRWAGTCALRCPRETRHEAAHHPAVELRPEPRMGIAACGRRRSASAGSPRQAAANRCDRRLPVGRHRHSGIGPADMSRGKLGVTDHALVRWLQRTGAMDMEQLRKLLADGLARAAKAAGELDAGEFLILADGMVFVVKDGTVVTVEQEDGRHRHARSLTRRRKPKS